MKAIYTFAFLASLSLGAEAQNAFDAMDLATKDLNGTARFVSMGGALGALGGDVSSMHTNPAGTALFRRSTFVVGAGGMSSNENVLGQSNIKMSFDYIGAVFSFSEDPDEAPFKLGIGIKDDRNYFGNLGVNVGGLTIGGKPTFSQTYQIADYANTAFANDAWGTLADLSVVNTIPGKEHEGILAIEEVTRNGRVDTMYCGIPAQSAQYYRATNGYNTVCDLNVSVNIDDWCFIGANLGIHWMNMQRTSEYSEDGIYVDSEGQVSDTHYLFENFYETTGYGVDFKIGAIFRPFADSPLRFGFTYKTPTAYSLTDRNSATLFYGASSVSDRYDYSSYTISNGNYDYNYNDPWSINLSLGYTVGRNFAIGAEYEYEDFSSANYSSAYENVLDDLYFRKMNRVIKNIAKSQHTFRIGAEYKPTENVSLRLGYNYITSPYTTGAFKEVGYDSPHSETDWVNWKNVQRITAGVGFRFDNCFLDFAYQYHMQKGDFYAFNDFATDEETKEKIYFESTEISANRGKLQMTFGVRF
jgi:long-subunit fatty acid transport protein